MQNNFTVYVIGGDHHNTLAVIRCLGYEKVNLKIVIHGSFHSKKDIQVSYSKYSKNIEFVGDTEEEILQWILKEKKENEKPILFPCSDLAAYTIDKNYSVLEKNFILHGFMDQPGKVVKLMDKAEQKKWADANHIPMAPTWNIKLSEERDGIVKRVVYPCIVKPKISALGEKTDIRICQDEQELIQVLDMFQMKGYDEVLLQKFLIKKFEVCAIGCVLNNSRKYIYCILQKIREKSLSEGTTVFAKFINEKNIDAFLEKILNKLHAEGYRGLFDIELFVCEDGVYLNEINFRHSGNGYAAINNGIKFPYIWCLDANGFNMDNQNLQLTKQDNCYVVNEIADFKLLLDKEITLKEFLHDIRISSCYARMNQFDIKGSFGFIIVKLRKVIKKQRG